MFASWGRRAVAYLVDQCLVLGIVGVLMALFAVVVASADLDLGSMFAMLLALEAVVFVTSLVYLSIPFIRRPPRRGQSFGKQALGIRIERIDGLPIGFGTFAKRVLLSGVLGVITFGLFWIAAYLWPLIDDRRQALYDKIAGTIVTDLRSDGPVDKPQPIATAGPIVAFALVSVVVAIAGFVGAGSVAGDKINETGSILDAGYLDDADNYSDDSSEDPATESSDTTVDDDVTTGDEDLGAEQNGLLPVDDRSTMEVDIQQAVLDHHQAIVDGEYYEAWRLLSQRKRDQYEQEGGYAKWKRNQQTLTPYLDPSGISVSLERTNSSTGEALVYVSGMGWSKPSAKCSEWSGYTWAKYEEGAWRYDPGYSTTSARERRWKSRFSELMGGSC